MGILHQPFSHLVRLEVKRANLRWTEPSLLFRGLFPTVMESSATWQHRLL